MSLPTNHDEEMLEEYDFSQAKRGLVIPQPDKTRITLWVDTDVCEAYMAYVARLCRDVAPEMNDALRQYIEALGAQAATSAETPHAVWLKNSAASRRVAVIVAQQPAYAVSTPHLTAVAPNTWLWGNELVAETLMIPLRMIVAQVLVDRIIQCAFTQHNHLLQGLLLDGAHEPFTVGVHIRTPWRQDDRLHATVFQEPIEGLRELRIPVVHQRALAHKEPLKGIPELPGTLLHEDGGGMWRDARDLHTARGQLHHDEDVVGYQAMPRRHLHREEIGCGEDLPVPLQAWCPAHAGLPPLRGGLHVVATQDVAHGQLVHLMPQIRQSALDASITPGSILLGHTYNQLLHLLGDTRSATLLSLLAPVKLLGDQLLGPMHEGIWRGERGNLFEALATERVSERSETAAFGVGEAEPATVELGFENAVFLVQISDDVLLMTLNPAGDHGDEHVQDHALSSRWKS
jgi:hypothetical protein